MSAPLLPKDIITVEQLQALRAAGWIVVREDAIRLAQAHAVGEERERKRLTTRVAA